MAQKIIPTEIDDQGYPLSEIQSAIERVLVRHERYEHPQWRLGQFSSHTVAASGNAQDNIDPAVLLKPNFGQEILVYGIFFHVTAMPANTQDQFYVILLDKLANFGVTVFESIFTPDFGGQGLPAAQPTDITWPWLIKGVQVPYTSQWIPPEEPLILRPTLSGDTRQYLSLQLNTDATVGNRTYIARYIYAIRNRLVSDS